MQKILDNIDEVQKVRPDNDEVQKVRPDNMVLVEQASLCMTSKLPMSYVQLNRVLWEAFHLGKKYRDKGGKE